MQVSLWECSTSVMDASQKDDSVGAHDSNRYSSVGSDSPRNTNESTRRSSIGSEEADSDPDRPLSKKRRRTPAEDTSSTLQERWDEMFERLRVYKEANGNCNVPNR